MLKSAFKPETLPTAKKASVVRVEVSEVLGIFIRAFESFPTLETLKHKSKTSNRELLNHGKVQWKAFNESKLKWFEYIEKVLTFHGEVDESFIA